MKVFSTLYDWMLTKARHRFAVYWLAGLSFAESSFFPIPPDVMLAPMALAKRQRAFFYAAVTTIASVIGGLFGYLIGAWMLGSIEPWLLESGYAEGYLKAREWFDSYGIWVVFLAGFSPIPYKVFTIGAGAAAMNLPGFLLASIVGRGARFFLVSSLIVLGGEKMETQLRRYVDVIGWGVVVLVAGGLTWYFVH
ncbi:MAG: YqaA family protein [Pseudomonadota bacterium]